MTAECKYQEVESQEVMPNYNVSVNYCKLKQSQSSDLACKHCGIKKPDYFEALKQRLQTLIHRPS